MSQLPKPDLVFTVGFSRCLIKWVVFIHGLALVASVANPLQAWVKVGLLLSVSISAWLTVRRLLLQSDTIKYSEIFGWHIRVANKMAIIDILPSTVITNYALFLHFKTRTDTQSWLDRRTQTRLIFYDALSIDEFRCLIVKLKTSAIK